MARLRRTSAVLEAARQRLAGLKSITPEPDLGPNFNLATYDTRIKNFTTRLDTYNQHLASIDEELNELDSEEILLREDNRRALAAVEAQFGPDSSEYEQVGGTRSSERKRPTKKSGGPPPTP